MDFTNCIAVIFSSELTDDDPAYKEAAAQMERLAEEAPGFLGIESYRNGSRGVTISYWKSEDSIRMWRNDPRHLEVQAHGRSDWYKRYTLRVARIVREKHFHR